MSSTSDNSLVDILDNEPMYCVLAQFLETPDNKNITTVLSEICTELKGIRVALEKSSRTSKSE